jgi:hypothetical protein
MSSRGTYLKLSKHGDICTSVFGSCSTGRLILQQIHTMGHAIETGDMNKDDFHVFMRYKMRFHIHMATLLSGSAG